MSNLWTPKLYVIQWKMSNKLFISYRVYVVTCDIKMGIQFTLVFTVPYSREYSTLSFSPGSLPFLRTGAKPQFSLNAMRGAKRNPRDSKPTISSTLGALALMWSTITSINSWKTSGLRKTGKMSLKKKNSLVWWVTRASLHNTADFFKVSVVRFNSLK